MKSAMRDSLLLLVIAWTILIAIPLCSSNENPTDGMRVRCTDGRVISFPDSIDEDMTSLNLSHCELSQIPQLPASALPRLRQLQINFNELKRLDHHSLPNLPQLLSFDASHNHISTLGHDTFRDLLSLQTLFLHQNNLTQFSAYAFLSLSHLLTLRLDNNHIESLATDTFAGLASLTVLDISSNALITIANNSFSDLVSLEQLVINHNENLQWLEPAAFAGLENLKEIHLDYNQLQLRHSSLPAGVFAPFHSLESFSFVHIGVLTDEFPEGVFNGLVSVKDLTVASSYEIKFGSDFRSMSSIHTVDLSRNCMLIRLSNDSLSGFKNSSLEVFSAESCRLTHIEICTFCDLPYLKYLRLGSNTIMKLDIALLSLYGLQGQNIQEIDLHNSGHNFPEFFSIDHNNARYLKNICVKRFNINRSHIQRWTVSAIPDTATFLSCVEEIDASENHLKGDLAALIRMLINGQNMTKLFLQNQNFYSLELASCLLSKADECEIRGPDHSDDSQAIIYIPLHDKLIILNVSSTFSYYFAPPRTLSFSSAHGLKTLGVAFGALSHCVTTLVGLENLETLDLSGNYCDSISDDLLDHLPSLQHLLMSNVHLQATGMRTRAQRLFQNVVQLKTLDLSRNWLVELEGRRLPSLRHLERFIASYNSFQFLPVDLAFHPNLTVLDLSFNDITFLTSSERQELETLASRHPVSLSLRGNPLVCSCSSLDFLQWLWDAPLTLDGEGANRRGYTCTSDAGNITDTEQMMAQLQVLWRRCVGKEVFSWTLVAFFVLLLGLLLAYLVCCSWTHLKYAWHVFKRLQMPRRIDFRKDLYIAYADNDAELACIHYPRCLQGNGLRILLRHQEEMPGTKKADNIPRFIDDSWKVLLLVTEAFVRDDWSSGFTVQQAQYSITHTLPNRVLVVFVDLPAQLPPLASLERLLRNYPEDNVFYLPRDTPSHHALWDRLAKAILKP